MKIFFVILISILTFGCNKIEEDNSNEYILVKNTTINVYNEAHIYDYLEHSEYVKIISDNELIDTENLGKKEYTVVYQKDKKKYSKKIEFNIVDTEAPIVFGGTNKTVNVGYDKDACDLITYGDNYDGEISCVIEGEYDYNKIGTYKLIYHLKDSSNNTKDVNVTLNVAEKSTSNNGNTNTKKTNFLDIYNKYKKANTEVGIDVSKWQGNIDFEKVKNAGASFVMMRIGVQGKAKGELSIDKYYEQNIKKAKAAGLKVGVYLYSIATSKEEAIKHADWVIETLNKETLDLPVVFDWENWSKWNSYKLSFHDINVIADTYMDKIKNAGYTGMLYSSKFYLETVWQNKKNYPVWLAHYTNDAKESSYKGDYSIWQLCNNGRIDGINGDVDIDVLYHK